MVGAFALLLGFVPCCPVNNNFAYVWLLELIVENVAMWGTCIADMLRRTR